jgi:hypothetical protein
MTKDEFDELRRMSGKEISVDILFVKTKHLPEEVVIFDRAPVENSMDYEIFLNGHYNRKTGSLTFNFTLQGVGPICRVDVNGAIHGDQGRTHKHELTSEQDPNAGLPIARARSDFEGKTAREVWELICKLAKIENTGTFFDPE